MKNTMKSNAYQNEELSSVIETKKIEQLNKQLVVLKYMLGILMFVFVAIVVEII